MTDVTGARLVAAILDFLTADDLLPRDEVRAQLEREVDAAGSAALLNLKTRLSEDHGWTYYPRDALAQRIHHVLADRFLQAGSRLDGLQHLETVPAGPVVICANHLSYADANVIEVLLHRNGAETLANRLTALAGPKVFTSRQRRFSSLCFGTVKVPQSVDVASGEAAMSAREVARAARESIQAARARLASGDALVLFGEGTRSRTGAMQWMLPAVARYLDVPGTWVIPVALTGPETLFPLEGALRPACVTMRIGAGVRAEDLFAGADGDRRIVVDAIGKAIAAGLPPSYRGVYAAC
jgi:1-acyl-sn-glycerol-3-phosphate acyltransferase